MSQTQGTSTMNITGAVSLAAIALVAVAVSCSAGSPVGAGVAADATATTAIEIVIQEVDAQDHQPVPNVWVRLLGGAHNVSYRSERTGRESRQVLAFTDHTVRFENDLPELRPTRARNR